MTNSLLGNGTFIHLNFTQSWKNGGAGPRKSLDQVRHARNIGMAAVLEASGQIEAGLTRPFYNWLCTIDHVGAYKHNFPSKLVLSTKLFLATSYLHCAGTSEQHFHTSRRNDCLQVGSTVKPRYNDTRFNDILALTIQL
jgi:hypothetical protein